MSETPGAAPVASEAMPRPSRGRRRIRRRLLYGLAAAGAIVLIGYILRPAPVEVEMGAVARGPMEVTIEAEGVTRVRERYTISAPITGRLARLAVRENDRVARGAIVGWLAPAPVDPREEAQTEAQLASARALVTAAAARTRQARALLDQAEREAARRQILAAAGALSQEQREQAELVARVRRRELESAEAEERSARADAASARLALMGADPERPPAPAIAVPVRAPAAGRVLRVPDRSDRVVTAGTPLLEVGDARALEVVVDVLSTDAVSIRPATPFYLTAWGGPDTLTGRVKYVEPAAFEETSALGVDEQRVNVVGELDSIPASLGDAYRVEASFVIWQAPDVRKVPSSALFQQRGGWAVFVVEGGRARLRSVVPGRRGADETQILKGLAPGERVVLYPSDQVTDGVRVRPAPPG